MSLDIATVDDRVTFEDVITVNKIGVTIKEPFINKHLKIARTKIKLLLGESFTIAGTSYPELYDDAVAKKTYALMLPFMHTFYQQEYPDSQQGNEQFYLSPSQVSAMIAELETEINWNIQQLKDEISISNGSTINSGGLILSAAGANPKYKTHYINKGADYDDKKQ